MGKRKLRRQSSPKEPDKGDLFRGKTRRASRKEGGRQKRNRLYQNFPDLEKSRGAPTLKEEALKRMVCEDAGPGRDTLRRKRSISIVRNCYQKPMAMRPKARHGKERARGKVA